MTSEPIYQQRGGYTWAWPTWWFAILSFGASWPFCNMKIYSDFIEIRVLFFPVRYSREEIAMRRWTLFPVLIDGVAIDKTGSSGFRLFSTFRAGRLMEELQKAGY